MPEPRVAIVTGASRGIGYATAQAFLQAGARVGVCAVDAERLADAARRLGRFGPVEARVADVREPDEVEALVAAVLERFGRIDVLVANAGRAWAGPFAEQSAPSIRDLVETNVNGVLFAARAVLPHMLARAQGVIVNVASGAGLAGFAGLAVYCATKFAVVGFTESLAREVGARGVRVYAVCPGRVATDMQAQYSGKRIGTPPERVAEAIVALAGPRPPAAAGTCLEVG